MRKAIKTMIELLSPALAPPVVEAVRVKRHRIKETKPRQPGGGRKCSLTDALVREVATSSESVSALATKYEISRQTIYNYRAKARHYDKTAANRLANEISTATDFGGVSGVARASDRP